MKKSENLLIIVLLCLSFFTMSQVGMGQWEMHVSPYVAKDLVYADGIIYCILENGLLEYDTKDEESTLWTAADYLSDASPTAIAYHKKSGNLLIGYENGNLDLLRNNSIYNIPALIQSNTNGIKRINKIVVHGDYAYLATGVGVVVVNMKKREIKDTYHPTLSEQEYLDIAFHNDSIYVLTKLGVYVGGTSNQFLADPSQWNLMGNLPDYSFSGRYLEIETYNNQLFLLYKNDSIANSDSIFQINNGIPTYIFGEKQVFGINGQGNKLLISTYGSLLVYDTNLTQSQVIFQYGEEKYPYPMNACFANDKYYIADKDYGLMEASNSYNRKSIGFEGPRYNSAYRVEWRKGKLSIACGGMDGTNPSFNQRGGSTMEDFKWKYTAINHQKMLKNTGTWDFISTAINPTNIDQVAYGTLSNIPLIITNNGEVTDTFTFSNSIIEEMTSVGWGYISALTYDEDGNLWIGNSFSNKPLKVLTKNGIWYDFNLGNQVKNKTVTRLIIDNNGVKWMGLKGGGVVAFDEGASIDDAGDDRYRILNTGPNSGDLPSNDIESIAADFDNNIWVGTTEGMRVLYNSANVFDASPGKYNFQKLLIKYGENVEIVLGTSQVASIQVDGDNRKWIGTANAGAFLLAADGLEVIRNFTSENSPLLSNSVLDIAIDQTTGVVYFVTEKGLISYRSDASEGDQEYSNVKVFPNPVRPEFHGPITIQGIAYDSDIKITDVSGKVVYKTKSHGGTATWSGNTMDGKRAATGVYIIWTSIDSDEFKGRKVGKVLLIN